MRKDEAVAQARAALVADVGRDDLIQEAILAMLVAIYELLARDKAETKGGGRARASASVLWPFRAQDG